MIWPKLAKSVSGHEICQLVICLQKMLVYRRQILDRQILFSLEEQILNGVDIANKFVIFFIDHAIWPIVAVIESYDIVRSFLALTIVIVFQKFSLLRGL